MTVILRKYQSVRHLIKDGDLLLVRGVGLLSRFGKYTHAAMAGWWGTSLMMLESREFIGGRVVTLASQVAKFSTKIDVYRPLCSDEQRIEALHNMRRIAGSPYGWRELWIACLTRVGLGSLAPIHNEPSNPLAEFKSPRFCSHAFDWAFKRAGFRLTEKPSHLVAPFELAESVMVKPLFSLMA